MGTFDFSRGSEWRKWDLHLHTTSSYDYKYKSDDADELLVKALKENNISAVCITDHFIIDKNKIEKLRQLASDIVFFPGVELRTDKGDTNIHVILIFDITTDMEVLSEDFNAFKRQKGKSIESDERIYWDFNDIVNFAKEHGGLISIHAGKKANGLDNRITNSLEHNQAVKEEFAANIDIFEMGQVRDLDDYKKHVFPSIGQKPMIICSDNHDPRNYSTKESLWIKADLTFDGLKQILYDPDSRIKIQKDDPTYEREKSPFTEILISENTRIFSDDDDVLFETTTLPLNNNLVSIIGGRGTGKSQLINYLAASFNREYHPQKYNLDTNIIIKRKTSLSEDAKEFKVSDAPNAPFMYIAQSEIKNLVEKKDEFSHNILETIGVTDTYGLSSDYAEKANALVNEYYRITKILNADGKPIKERKKNIQNEIKKYSDFIQNITSEQNKKKLEDYKKKVEKLHRINVLQEKVTQQYEKNARFANEANATIQLWNEQFKNAGINIPLINIQPTQDYLKGVLMPKLESSHQKTTEEIENTKNEFKDYKGDLTSLLSNVSSYQRKLSELIKEKELVEQEEKNLLLLSTESFKSLGKEIQDSIVKYTTLISNKWKEFKGEIEPIDETKKKLLDIILQKGLEVEAEVFIDTNKMYNILLEKLDGRSFNLEKLHQLLGIDTIQEFYDFVGQNTEKNVFSLDKEELKKQILNLFYKRYTDFIKIGVKVTLNQKPIAKLSYGQQGTIYLRLKIAANMFSETIIYDQPEDDLDNDFITNELIPIFKEIKLYRQVIIVSHNANLVVNADSEQVIIAQNKDGILSYISGSLENPTINKEVCRILEGGQKAFEDRERKYRIKNA